MSWNLKRSITALALLLGALAATVSSGVAVSAEPGTNRITCQHIPLPLSC